MLYLNVIPTMASVHKLPGKPNWICFFTDNLGKRRCKTTGTTNRKQAETVCNGFQRAADSARKGTLTETRARALIEQTVSELMESSGGKLERHSIKEYFTRWMKAREGTTSPSTHDRYSGIVRTFLDNLGERADASLLTLRSQDIERYRDSLEVKVSTGTVNTHLKVLRVALEKAVKKNQLDNNPAKHVENLARNDKHKRRAFTIPELKKLLSAASDEWRTMIFVGVYTGLRLSDIAGLTWGNLELQKPEITVETGKTGRVVILPIAKPLLNHLISLPMANNPKEPLCPNLCDKPNHWLSNQFYELMADVGLVQSRGDHQKKEGGQGRQARRRQSEITFHALRHTATSLLKNAGVSDIVVRDIIGHESEAISRNYTHIDSETKRAALERLPDVTAG
jgi:integrase